MRERGFSGETTVVVSYPIVGAIHAVEEFLNKKWQVTSWEHQNEIQRKFIDNIVAACKREIPLIQEIECIAHLDVEVVNEWLEHHGFSIQLRPTSAPGFSVASKLDLSGYWESLGTVIDIFTDEGEKYPGVKMKHGYEFFQTDSIENLILKIGTEGEEEVYMVMVDQVPLGFELIEFVEGIQSKMRRAMIEYTEVHFPMIDLDHEGPLDWILGMRVYVDDPSVPYHMIAQALQQTKLKMNEKGFRIKSAAAMQMVLGAALFTKYEPYIINRPFLMWVKKPTLSKPLLVGYFNHDVWKNPSGLEM
ncbi:MAG: hypothetical protein JW779_15025 [Candidatus Thorarchaeota archaeon]|nr:hypothetical protein [Candidatus Thorarchaeota archaeon]